MSKHVWEECGKRADGDPDGRTDGHHHTIIRPVWRRAYKKEEIWQQEAQRATYRAPEYNVPPYWGIGQGWHFCLLIRPKNTNLVLGRGIKILHPVKFCWIPFSGFRIYVENVSANQRPGRPSCFSEKHKLGRGRWDLASCQVSMNSVQLFQRRRRKCNSQSEARAASCFSDRP